ncbi:uncharacterized protein SAPINGB_P000572 [Magnusiomyces paraingens]|uniref:Peroxisomal membrane protein 4 n=1 Tax=Magnusiomyces paraingens TaxID=2606893 RepID=A0A5E8B0I1_9ASCO|nr:uncharacterized protein SAPINGB_P000572 [Saprochaete ingens]VVT44902.1 unnamed protein product [Saprochaete ingens]
MSADPTSYSSSSNAILNKLNEFLTNENYHDLLAILKGTRNGIVYGAKLRFCHALVMSFLFRSGPIKDRWHGIVKNTKQHARALGSFVFVYKSALYLLKLARPYLTTPSRFSPSASLSTKLQSTLDDINTHKHPGEAFVAGLIAGYAVFGYPGKNTGLATINQQMVLYVFSRIFLGLCKLLLDKILQQLSVISPEPSKSRHSSVSSSSSSTSTSSTSTSSHSSHKHVKGAVGLIDFATQVRRLSPRARAISNAAWSLFAAVCWGLVMALFRMDSTLLQSSMVHSMKNLYVDSESWHGWWDFLW